MKASPAKFGNGGEVTSSAITVTVKDTGSGIDPDFLKMDCLLLSHKKIA